MSNSTLEMPAILRFSKYGIHPITWKPEKLPGEKKATAQKIYVAFAILTKQLFENRADKALPYLMISTYHAITTIISITINSLLYPPETQDSGTIPLVSRSQYVCIANVAHGH